MNSWPLVAGLLLVLVVGFTGYRHGVKTTADQYQRAIAEGQVQAEIATRRAVEAARLYERSQRDAMAAAAQDAVAKARADEAASRKRFTNLQRAIQEAADADPTVDAWRRTAVPDPVRLLLSPRDTDPAGRGAAISVPPNPTGTAG